MAAKPNPPRHIRSSKLEPYTLLSTYEVGLVLNKTPQTVRRMIHTGMIPAKVDESGRFRIPKKDLVAYINGLPDAHTPKGVRT